MDNAYDSSRLEALLEHSTTSVLELGLDGTYNLINKAAAEIFGLPASDIIGKNLYDFLPVETVKLFMQRINTIQETAKPMQVEDVLQTETGLRYYLSNLFPILDDNRQVRAVGAIARDITEQKEAENYREMRQEILHILNKPEDFQKSIQQILTVLKSQTRVDAVGLRLQEGEDFPYFCQDGFPKDFLLTENSLIEYGKDGDVCRDEDGNLNLECTCGLVISGKFDPSNPLFTQGGSSWTNNSYPFLELSGDQDIRLNPRNNCIHQGYASVALIPIRVKEQIVGLIQLNSKNKGHFTLETIEILEGIAAHIGSALMRKQKEKELESALSRSETYLNTANIIIVSLNTQGFVTMLNRYGQDCLGYTLEEIIGENWFALVLPQPEGLEKIYPFFRRILDGDFESARTFENEVVTSSGERRVIAWTNNVLLDDKGNISEVVSFGMDVTERKQSEMKLAESEDLLSKAQEISHTGSWQLNVETTALLWSDEVFRIFGCKPQEFPATYDAFLDFIHPDDRATVDKAYSQSLKEGSNGYTIEHRIIRRDTGEVRYVHERYDHERNDEGSIIRSVGMVHDITERKIAEDALLAAKEKAEESNRLKDAFLANLSHEIRTPLNGIMGFASFLADPDYSDRQKQNFAKMILASGHRMVSLIDALVDMAKIESGTMTIQRATLNINKELRTIVANFQKDLDSVNMSVKLDFPLEDAMTVLYTDTRKFYSIVSNLIENAIKFASNGNVELGYTKHEKEWEFYVKDSGIGLPKEMLYHIFERFFQLDDSYSKAQQGAGLGLAITKAYVEMLGGRIWVESEEGQGSTFFFTL